MPETEKTYTYAEFEREFLSKSFLERLRDSIVSSNLEGCTCGEVKPGQKTGTLEFYQTGAYKPPKLDQIKNSIALFYQGEGFKVEVRDKTVSAEKKDEEYWIMVLGGSDNYYVVDVMESPFSKRSD